MTIRHAWDSDVPEIVALLNPERNRVGFFPPGAVYDHVGRLGTAVALIGGKLVGVISGYRSLRYARWCRPITFLVVDPRYRRRGIATALVAHISRQAVDDGQLALQAWTRQDVPGWQLWTSLCFDPICVKHEPTADKKATILFRRRLTAVPHVDHFKAPPVAGWRAAKLTAVLTLNPSPPA
jgi:GNAT superfamily N-acetyltransferase